jgi:hypothetical protein
MKRHSLLSYLDKRLGRHSGNGPEYTFHCPACIDRIGSDTDKKKFALNIVRQKGQCFRCEFKFRELAHLFRYINGGFVTPEERILLRDEPPMVTTSVKKAVRDLLGGESRKAEHLRRHRLPRGTRALAKVDVGTYPWKRGFDYWESRGFDYDDALRFDVHYCPPGATYGDLDYSGYLLFPVVQDGERVYWTTRYCGKHHIKSKNPPKREGYYSREHCLLNYDAVIGEKTVTLVEGPTDCAAYEVAVALLGKEMSPFQAALLFALVEHGLEELIVNLDPGTARKVDAIVEQMRDGIPTVSTLYFDHGDPCSRRAELHELAEQRKESPSLGDRIRSRLVHD